MDWAYLAVAAIGGLVGMSELVARYRDEPARAVRNTPALVYIGINASASILALADCRPLRLDVRQRARQPAGPGGPGSGRRVRGDGAVPNRPLHRSRRFDRHRDRPRRPAADPARRPRPRRRPEARAGSRLGRQQGHDRPALRRHRRVTAGLRDGVDAEPLARGPGAAGAPGWRAQHLRHGRPPQGPEPRACSS